jgi:septal ring factor EnvC (AmiA/AmiB activator)
MKLFPRAAAFVLLLSLLPWALSAEQPLPESLPDFSLIDSNLEKLESLITDTLNNSETLNQQLADLNLALSESELSTREQEALLKELRTQVNEMSATYRTLSDLSKKYEASSKFWRNFTLIGIPAAVVISGLAVGLAVGLR